ncbi:hypothetical protein BU15DRAFT_62793 [Melanogaster broomeanus]|nr:hypothetical protein BU15DRAFT_62793 [Melanogaster broomeanus]
MTRVTSRHTPLAAVTITHLHRTPRFTPLLTPPPHNERSIHSCNDNDNDIDALMHVVAVTIVRRGAHATLTNRSPAVSTCPDDSWDDMDNCGKCLDYFYGGPCPDRELFHPWRKKSPAAIEAEQQLKEDKHPTKKHACVQKVTRPKYDPPLHHLKVSLITEGSAPSPQNQPRRLKISPVASKSASSPHKNIPVASKRSWSPNNSRNYDNRQSCKPVPKPVPASWVWVYPGVRVQIHADEIVNGTHN